MARCEEYDKARTAANRAEEEGGSSTTKAVDKKKRLEEEARNKVSAPCHLRHCRKSLANSCQCLSRLSF